MVGEGVDVGGGDRLAAGGGGVPAGIVHAADELVKEKIGRRDELKICAPKRRGTRKVMVVIGSCRGRDEIAERAAETVGEQIGERVAGIDQFLQSDAGLE